MFTDWMEFYWQQISDPWHLTAGVFNVPWLFVAMQPLRLVGPIVSAVLVQLAAVLIVIHVSLKMRIPRWRIVMLVISPVMFVHVLFGQIDGLLLIALVVPPVWAALLTVAKPQTLLPIGWAALKKNPVMVAVACTAFVVTAYMIWGWLFSAGTPHPPIKWNFSIWPWGLLLVPLIFHRDERFGMLIAPFAFPYVGVASLWLPMFATARMPWWAFVLLWTVLTARVAVMLS